MTGQRTPTPGRPEGAERQLESLRDELYEQQIALVGELEGASRAREQLVSVVSHELRTPLTAILGFAELLHIHGHHLSDAERKEQTGAILEAGERLRELIENLTFAADDVGSGKLDRAGLSAAFGSVIQTVARERAIDVDIREDVLVRVQPPILRSILSNLMSNAAKFASTGSVVRVGVQRRGDDVEMTFTNQVDEPLNEAQLAQMFEPFVQIDSSDQRHVGGLGLGLHVARRLVEGHGGSLGLHAEGRTVTVTVHLPTAVEATLRQMRAAPGSSAS